MEHVYLLHMCMFTVGLHAIMQHKEKTANGCHTTVPLLSTLILH